MKNWIFSQLFSVRSLALTAALVVALVIPLALGDNKNLLNLAILVGIYYTVCIGLSLIFGLGGQLSFC